MNRRDLGSKGEDIACKYIEKLGYKILERNVHFSRYCEVDILAQDKETLVAIEVKTRTNSNLGSPLEAITQKKYQNIKVGLFSYLKENPKFKHIRIDAIGIVLKPTLDIHYLKNI